MDELQRAINSGIRAIYGIARFGYESISILRRKVKIPGIEDIRKFVCLKAAWDKRSHFKSKFPAETKTRRQSLKQIPPVDSRGWLGKCLTNTLTPYWNELPIEAKDCEDGIKIKSILKSHIFNFTV